MSIYLQRLTYLEIATVELQAPHEDTPTLKPLQALTRLDDLRLDGLYGADTPVLASTLSGMPLGSEWGASATALTFKHASEEPS